MATTQEAIDALRAEVERNTTVDGSAIALISSLASQLEAAKDDPEEIQAIVDNLRARNDELAAAVTANTGQTGEAPV